MSLRARCIAVADGLGLAGLGGFMLWLSASSVYWQYLNPKYRPLTVASAVVLLGLGLVAALRTSRRESFGAAVRPLIYFGFLALGLASAELKFEVKTRPAQDDIQYRLVVAPPPLDPSAVEEPYLDPARTSDAVKDAASGRATLAGAEYVPLNIGELFGLTTNGTIREPNRFVVRGIAVRDERLAKRGEFAVVRAAVYCCLADAIGVGFRVLEPLPAGLPDGAWVRLYCELTPSDTPKAVQTVRRKGLFVTSLHKDYALKAVHVEPIDPPGDPYMFQWRESEPFAY